MHTSSPPSSSSLRCQLSWAVILGLLSLFPFVVHHTLFSGLFYFGDDLALFVELDRVGLWKALLLPFAENIIPLYKLFWAAIVFGFKGSHLALITALWITHALNVGLLAFWMLRSRFNLFVTTFAALIFGLSYSNIETLAWAVQWSAVLSSMFFFLACLIFFAAIDQSRDLTKKEIILLLLLSAASGLCFSRGILTGPVLAVSLLLFSRRPVGSWPRQFGLAALLALPGIAIAIVVCLAILKNPGYVVQHPYPWRKALSFGTWYLTLNPIPNFYYGVWSEFTWNRVMIYGAIKASVFVLSLILANPFQRRLLSALLIFELGYAAQLAVGRSGGELIVAMSPRYQYISLITFTPAVGLILWKLFELAPAKFRLRELLAMATVIVGVWFANRHWATELPGWVEWRGLTARRALAEPPAPGKVEPLLPGTAPVAEVRRLQAEYNLH